MEPPTRSGSTAPASSASRPLGPDGRTYHVGVGRGDVAEDILMVGDPARVERVVAGFEAVELERRFREYVTVTGTYQGRRTSVVGTGMGAASTEIAVVELLEVTSRPTLIRAGSCGALDPGIELADLVISRAALRLEHTSTSYVDAGYPAIADHEVILALIEAAATAPGTGETWRAHVGVTATAPGFYAAQGRAAAGWPAPREDVIARLTAQRIANLEMEASCLLTLASLARVRAGAVCAVYASRAHDRFADADTRARAEQRCISVALEAFSVLARMDSERGPAPHWYPGLSRP